MEEPEYDPVVGMLRHRVTNLERRVMRLFDAFAVMKLRLCVIERELEGEVEPEVPLEREEGEDA